MTHIMFTIDGKEVYEYKLTPEERKEIAEYMIELWRSWAE